MLGKDITIQGDLPERFLPFGLLPEKEDLYDGDLCLQACFLLENRPESRAWTSQNLLKLEQPEKKLHCQACPGELEGSCCEWTFRKVTSAHLKSCCAP